MTYADQISQKFGIPNDQSKWRNAKRGILEGIERVDSRTLPKIASVMLRKIGKHSKSRLSTSLRFILTRFYQYDPLKDMTCEKFSVAILTSPKDLEILPYSLASIVEMHKEEIEEIFIIFPESLLLHVTKLINSLDLNIPINMVTDEEVIDSFIGENFKFSSTVPKMETVKLCLPSLSNSENMLVLDGDTIYLKKRVWKSKEYVCQVVAQEYMPEHVNFHKNILKLKCESGLGFVTHHSFFIRAEIESMITAWGGMKCLAAAIDFQVQQGFQSGAFPSEWQMYGDWISEQKIYKWAPARFDNLGISRKVLPLANFPDMKAVSDFLIDLKSAVPNLGSLSLHDYK